MDTQHKFDVRRKGHIASSYCYVPRMSHLSDMVRVFLVKKQPNVLRTTFLLTVAGEYVRVAPGT